MSRQILDKQSWIEYRETLKNSYAINDFWVNVIEMFRKRIYDFYFNPIKKIKDPNKLKGEGFTILTIQCALIEMLAAFRYGKIHNYQKGSRGVPIYDYEYKGADECFIRFLHSETIFENHFFTVVQDAPTQPNKPFSANDFYNKVRCGLMHEARTKGEWLINAKPFYKGNGSVFITANNENDTISVDRTILNNLLEKYFKRYLIELSESNDNGIQLRRLFGRKLDHLYDIPRDAEKFDWWEDR
jgi:hypothetical protein